MVDKKTKSQKRSVRERRRKNPKTYLAMIVGLAVIILLNWVIYKLGGWPSVIRYMLFE